MFLTFIIFFIAVISLFGMISFRAWEIKTSRVEIDNPKQKTLPELYFRHLEKIMLYSAKYFIQWVVLGIVKAWFIATTKIKKYIVKNLPKIYSFFQKKTKEVNQQKNTFVQRAILESRSKIRKIKEKVKRDHEENTQVE